MQPEALIDTARVEYNERIENGMPPLFGVSMYAHPSLSAQAIARLVPRKAKMIHWSTVGALIGAGFRIVPDDPPHHLVILSSYDPSECDARRLAALFTMERSQPCPP